MCASALAIADHYPVITELNGLLQNTDALGEAAQLALATVDSVIAGSSINIQILTSRGNYLRDRKVRHEDIDFGSGAVRTIDDVILQAAVHQKHNWVDRRGMLPPSAGIDRSTAIPSTTAKVLLCSNDKMLRIKAKARGIDALDSQGLQVILDPG